MAVLFHRVPSTRLGTVLSGLEFKKQYPYKFVKVIRRDRKHYNHKYVHGLNEDAVPFNPRDHCLPGGLYFTIEDNLLFFLKHGSFIVEVSIPDDAQVYVDEPKKFKADKIFVDLNNKIAIKDYPKLYDIIMKNKDFIDDGYIQHIPSQFLTEDIYFSLVSNGYSLEYVSKIFRTYKICEMAVMKQADNLQYVPRKLIDDKLCLSAVMKNALAIRFIPKELLTDKICLTAVSRNGLAIKYIPEEKRTYGICFVAVKNNKWVMQYITYESYRKQISEILKI